MDRRITTTVDASPRRTIAALSDLATYPEWLQLVAAATPDPTADGTWQVTLRARLGPLARSKRLRMTRTQLDETTVRFERNEVDGRDHADWILEATVTPTTAAPARPRSDVAVHLHYSGALWSAPLEIALAGFEGSAAQRLGAWLAGN